MDDKPNFDRGSSDSRSCRMASVLYIYRHMQVHPFFYHFGAVQDQSSMDGLFRAQKKMECTTHLLHNNVCLFFTVHKHKEPVTNSVQLNLQEVQNHHIRHLPTSIWPTNHAVQSICALQDVS